jgi:hypothetical protein
MKTIMAIILIIFLTVSVAFAEGSIVIGPGGSATVGGIGPNPSIGAYQ